MVRKVFILFISTILLSTGEKGQIIDDNCPFDYFPTVLFSNGSVALTKAAKVALDSFANYLIYNPTCSVTVIGSKGRGDNKLVRRRLAMILDYLKGKDVRESRFIVTYSASFPTTKIGFRKAS